MAANINHNSNVSAPLSTYQHLMSRSQELSYVQALKTHQMTRLDHIRNETQKLDNHLTALRKDVQLLESQRRRTTADKWTTQVTALREDNRALRIECHCLSMEVDLYASGGMPLGVTDENFYKNVPQGPYGQRPQPQPSTSRRPARPPYPVQPMAGRQQPPAQPPTYEESVYYPPPRFGNCAPNPDLLSRVPPAPRPVWLVSPTMESNTIAPNNLFVRTQSVSPSLQSPPQLPPRPNTTSPRLPVRENPMAAVVDDSGQPRWVCQKCTVENHPALNYCELCEMPRHS